MSTSLEEIVKGCKQQLESSRKLLYSKYSSLFYAICLRYLKDRDDACDIMHDSFIKIYEKVNDYNSEGSFEGWMKRIVVNNCLIFLNDKKKVLRIENELWVEKDDDVVEIEIEEGKQFDSALLFSLIQDLPLGYRTVFNLFIFDGYGHSEIAQKLKISEGTSKSQLAKARKYLKDKLIEIQKNEQKEYKYR